LHFLNSMPYNKCLVCNKEFYVRPSLIQRGWGKYCSSKCQYEGMKTGKFVVCAYCGKVIYRPHADLRRKSKTEKYFCNKSCQCAWKNKRRTNKVKNAVNLALKPLKRILKRLKRKNYIPPSNRPARGILYKVYWQERLPQEEIGQIFGVAHTTIQRWLKYYKIPIKQRTVSCGHNPNTLKNLELGHTEESYKRSGESRIIYSKEKLIKKIKEFARKAGRPPTKNEFINNPAYPDYRTYRDYFGTWNKAIKAAGYEPNERWFTQRNSRKLYAKDGHLCKSISEIIIDDWLFENNISHEREKLYPEGKYRCDFIIGNFFIEFFGLATALDIDPYYAETIAKKREMCKKYKIPLIEIYENDLYNLDQTLGEKLGIKSKQETLL